MNLLDHIRTIADFPKPGIQFKDITTLWANPLAFEYCIEKMLSHLQAYDCDVIAGLEARGLPFAAILAHRLRRPFVAFRKPGKLPGEVLSQTYELEYGKNTIEVHKDAILPGQKVVLVDDLLATGGTLKAACQLVERAQGIVSACMAVIELDFLNARAQLFPYSVDSLLIVSKE